MTESSSEAIQTLVPTDTPPNGRNIELVFRTVDERTSERALELAKKHIRPSKLHIVRNIKPFARAVERMLAIEHDCSHVVYVDADCLILEDMRPFLDANNLPFVDAYVKDRFRGRVPGGVHIARLDVVKKMQQLSDQYSTETEYLLRPESYLRNVALAKLGLSAQLKNFNILHDYLQSYEDIFAKYVVRVLRDKNDGKDISLRSMRTSPAYTEDDIVAEAAVRFTSSFLAQDLKSETIQKLLTDLPNIATMQVQKLTDARQKNITDEEFESLCMEARSSSGMKSKPKVFGIGLSRTGTYSLTIALHELGFDTVHLPADPDTFETLRRGDGKFSLLGHYDGITGITTIPVYQKLDTLYPGSKFILTVRDEASWLRSCYVHGGKRSHILEGSGDETEIQKVLRERVYGDSEFNFERYITTYRRHTAEVMKYFKGREQDLLVLDIVAGEGYDKLSAFLNVDRPLRQFPHRNISTERQSPEHKWRQLAEGLRGNVNV